MLGQIEDFDRFRLLDACASISVSVSTPSAASPVNFLFNCMAGEGFMDKKGELSVVLREPKVMGILFVICEADWEWIEEMSDADRVEGRVLEKGLVLSALDMITVSVVFRVFL